MRLAKVKLEVAILKALEFFGCCFDDFHRVTHDADVVSIGKKLVFQGKFVEAGGVLNQLMKVEIE
jgi:hypothetical protein